MRRLRSNKEEEGGNEEGEDFNPGDLFAEEVRACCFRSVQLGGAEKDSPNENREAQANTKPSEGQEPKEDPEGTS